MFVHLRNSNTQVFPTCPSLNNRNHHCVYTITSEKGYVNLSITKSTYTGPNFKEHTNALPQYPLIHDCLQGTVAFSTTKDAMSMQHLCDNYTTDLVPRNDRDKSLMNIVNEKREALIFVVYSYKYYSQVSVEATVTLTPCKGVSFCKCKFKIKILLNVLVHFVGMCMSPNELHVYF